MKHPQSYLVEKIFNSDKDNLPTLGKLEAKFIDDITQVMKDFAEETVIETIERLNDGHEIKIRDKFYRTKKSKR